MVAAMAGSVEPGTGVRPAESADEHEAAAEALALAFADDPCWAHLLPDAATRAERLLAFFSNEIETLVPRYREVWVSEDGGGAAIWAAPGRWRVPLGVTLGEAGGMLRVFGRRLPLALRASLRLESEHPKDPEHWYLDFLGVEPRRQGRGLGSLLLRPLLERCDREGIPAYLGASTDRNRMLYERHGFAMTEAFDMPGRGGPPIRKMWREPPSQTG
jgi:GNAT superfamily N-acetyltransferase